MSEFLKAEQIVAAALGLLKRDSVLPGLVWRDPVGADFKGAKNDTISIRIPGWAPARTRVMRSGSTRTRDDIYERKVDITLDTDIYQDIRITDEVLSLDIVDFATQVLVPVTTGISQKIASTLAAAITGAIYQYEIDYAYGGNPYGEIAVEARRLLNLAGVPPQQRRLVVGANVEAELLNDEKFVKASWSGTDQTLREAQIGRIAGFDVYPDVTIDPDEAYAFHQKAFALSCRAPQVPSGAPYGSSQSSDGYAMRIVRVLDSETIEDILAVDSWIGCNVVTDVGAMDGDVFTPAEDPDDSGASELLVRAVKITAASSS